MCLSKVKSRRAMIASEDITVYKVVTKVRRNVYRSPFLLFEYRVKKTYKSELVVTKDAPRNYSVHEGLHTFQRMEDAIENAHERNNWGGSPAGVLECVIPKDSMYYEGKFFTLSASYEVIKDGGYPSYASDALQTVKEIPIQ